MEIIPNYILHAKLNIMKLLKYLLLLELNHKINMKIVIKIKYKK